MNTDVNYPAPAPIYLSLGTNLGQRLNNLQCAVRGLVAAGLRLEAASGLYESAPWGVTDQPTFFNVALHMTTTLTPRQLLQQCQKTEVDCGRRPGLRWGPRLIDIDILLYADLEWDEPDLQIPHARLQQRYFMLAPLAEVYSKDQLPCGLSLARLLERNARQEVQRVMGPGWLTAEEVRR